MISYIFHVISIIATCHSILKCSTCLPLNNTRLAPAVTALADTESAAPTPSSEPQQFSLFGNADFIPHQPQTAGVCTQTGAFLFPFTPSTAQLGKESSSARLLERTEDALTCSRAQTRHGEQGSLGIINKVPVKQNQPCYVSTRPNKAAIEERNSRFLTAPLSLPFSLGLLQGSQSAAFVRTQKALFLPTALCNRYFSHPVRITFVRLSREQYRVDAHSNSSDMRY